MASSSSQFESKVGVQFEEDVIPRWKEICANDPHPPILGNDVDRNAYLALMGHHTHDEKLAAICKGVTRKVSGVSINRSDGFGLDGIRWVSETHLRALETKKNPTVSNFSGQFKMQLKSMELTQRKVEYEVMVPTGVSVTDALCIDLNIVAVHHHSIDESIEKVRRRDQTDSRTAENTDDNTSTSKFIDDIPYQVAVKDAALDAMKFGKRLMKFEIPTNSGKSYMIGMILRSTPPQIRLQIVLTPHVRLCKELADKIRNVVKNQKVIELHQYQKHDRSIKEACVNEVLNALDDRERGVPIVVSTNTTFHNVLYDVLRQRTDVPSLIIIDEAFAFPFNNKFADDIDTIKHIQWMLFSATLPENLEDLSGRKVQETIVESPLTYSISYIDSVRHGCSLPVHFYVLDTTLPFLEGAMHFAVAKNKKKIMVFSPSQAKVIDAETQMSAVLSEYNLSFKIFNVISSESNSRKYMEAFQKEDTSNDIEIFNACQIGRFGIDNHLVDLVVPNFDPSDFSKIGAAAQINQMGSRVRFETWRDEAPFCCPDRILDNIVAFTTKYDPNEEYTRVSFQSSDPKIFFATRALAQRDVDDDASAIRYRRYKSDRNDSIAKKSSLLSSQEVFETRVRALLETNPCDAPANDDIMIIGPPEEDTSKVHIGHLKMQIKTAYHSEGHFHVDASLRADIENCKWLMRYIDCDNTRLVENTTCVARDAEYKTKLALLEHEPIVAADVIAVTEKIMLPNGSGLRSANSKVLILLDGTGKIHIKRKLRSDTDTVVIPGLADMRLSHDLYPIRDAIREACSKKNGGDRDNGGYSSSFSKIIIYQHYRMSHSACVKIYDCKMEHVSKVKHENLLQRVAEEKKRNKERKQPQRHVKKRKGSEETNASHSITQFFETSGRTEMVIREG